MRLHQSRMNHFMSGAHGLLLPCLLAPMSKTVVLEIKPGDCVAVQPPHQTPWLGQVLYVEASSRMTDRCFAQVIRDDDLAVICICPSWILDRIPGTGTRVMA